MSRTVEGISRNPATKTLRQDFIASIHTNNWQSVPARHPDCEDPEAQDQRENDLSAHHDHDKDFSLYWDSLAIKDAKTRYNGG